MHLIYAFTALERISRRAPDMCASQRCSSVNFASTPIFNKVDFTTKDIEGNPLPKLHKKPKSVHDMLRLLKSEQKTVDAVDGMGRQNCRPNF